MPDALKVHFNQKHFAVKRFDQGGLGNLVRFFSLCLSFRKSLYFSHNTRKKGCAQKHFEVSIHENSRSYTFNLMAQSFEKTVKCKLDLG